MALLFEGVERVGVGLREGNGERQRLDGDAVLPRLVGAGPIATGTQRDQAVPERGLLSHGETGRDTHSRHPAVGEGRVSGGEQPADLVLSWWLSLEQPALHQVVEILQAHR